ncbi:hypothetical protein ACFLZT_04255 [Thermodesulfobacteriota bacterium]
MSQTLGILVSSDSHWDDVFQLTRAAVTQGRKVILYLAGNGVLLVHEPVFEMISSKAAVYVCRESCKVNGMGETIKGISADQIVTSEKQAEIIEGCDRYLVL